MRLDSLLIMKYQQTKRGANKRFHELGDQQNVKVRFLFFFPPRLAEIVQTVFPVYSCAC